MACVRLLSQLSLGGLRKTKNTSFRIVGFGPRIEPVASFTLAFNYCKYANVVGKLINRNREADFIFPYI